MKRLIPIILLAVTAMVMACSQGEQQSRLVLVDSLMSNYQTDSAYRTFKQIDLDKLNSQDEQMYYAILTFELSQQAVPRDSLPFSLSPDSALSRCIDYYEHAHDPRNLLPIVEQ